MEASAFGFSLRPEIDSDCLILVPLVVNVAEKSRRLALPTLPALPGSPWRSPDATCGSLDARKDDFPGYVDDSPGMNMDETLCSGKKKKHDGLDRDSEGTPS